MAWSIGVCCAKACVWLFPTNPDAKSREHDIEGVLKEGPESFAFIKAVKDVLDQLGAQALASNQSIQFDIDENYVLDAMHETGRRPDFNEDSVEFVIACINGYAHERGWHFMYSDEDVGVFVPWDGEAPRLDDDTEVDEKAPGQDDRDEVPAGSYVSSASSQPKKAASKPISPASISIDVKNPRTQRQITSPKSGLAALPPKNVISLQRTSTAQLRSNFTKAQRSNARTLATQSSNDALTNELRKK